MALVVVLPTSEGLALMHLQTLLILTGDTPLIGLEEMYEAPDHH